MKLLELVFLFMFSGAGVGSFECFAESCCVRNQSWKTTVSNVALRHTLCSFSMALSLLHILNANTEVLTPNLNLF